ncbi:hypothetical protein ACQEUU_33420 [Nonomuraea sp. CA-218870]|uniref:hypothetical protein n=1 Tax=Nonomuraea sp. CA-218870 TaxID=3239998 RepID=UPI003D9157B8
MTTYDRAIEQARDLLRWRSPLRTELWASRLAAEADQDLLDGLARSERPEARLALAALAAVDAADLLTPSDPDTPPTGQETDHPTLPDEADPTAHTPTSRETEPSVDGAGEVGAGEVGAGEVRAPDLAGLGREALTWLPGWAGRMGRVRCEGAWYGRGDRYGEQVLAALAFRYANGKEPHLLVVGIDQAHGGLAVDAVVEEPTFLDDLGLAPAPEDVVAGRVLDAFEVTDLLMGAEVADSLPAVRALALSRARSVPDPVRHAPDETFTAFEDLPALPGADEAFGALAEFLGERPLWWSPARVSAFLTSWLPREAILGDAAIAAMPEVLRAWTRHLGDHEEILDRIAAEAPRLPALMADDSLAGLAKRVARSRPR